MQMTKAYLIPVGFKDGIKAAHDMRELKGVLQLENVAGLHIHTVAAFFFPRHVND